MLRIYLRLQLTQLQSGMSHRGDFLVLVVGVLLQQSVSLVFLWVFFSQVDELGGWSVWDIVVLQGIVLISTGLADLVGDGSWQLRGDVNTGAFDRVLVRPLPAALQQATSRPAGHGLGHVGLGLTALILGMTRADVMITWWTIPLIIVAALSGGVIHLAINFITNMTVFWEPSASSGLPTLVGRLREFAKYPLTIYEGITRVLVTIIPYAFVGYFPTLLILDRGGPERLLGWTAPSAAALMAGIAALLWRSALRRYQGVGH